MTVRVACEACGIKLSADAAHCETDEAAYFCGRCIVPIVLDVLGGELHKVEGALRDLRRRMGVLDPKRKRGL